MKRNITSRIFLLLASARFQTSEVSEFVKAIRHMDPSILEHEYREARKHIQNVENHNPARSIAYDYSNRSSTIEALYRDVAYLIERSGQRPAVATKAINQQLNLLGYKGLMYSSRDGTLRWLQRLQTKIDSQTILRAATLALGNNRVKSDWPLRSS